MVAGKRLTISQHLAEQQRRAAQRGGQRYQGKLRNWRAKQFQGSGAGGDVRSTLYCVLAAKAGMVELPIHGFHKIQEQKQDGDDKGKTAVWGDQLCCFEDNAVVEAQYQFNDDATRKWPPLLCPMCRFNEWMRLEIEAGNLDWLQKIFRFESQTNEVILHAGGMLGMYGGYRDLSEEDRDAIHEARISIKDAFKENATAGIKFLYCVGDLSELDKGLQATLESKSLGSGVTDLINERVTDMGAKGDPTVNPFAMKWIYRPNEKSASDKYSVKPVGWDEMPEKFGKPEKLKERAIELAMSDKIPPVFDQMRRYPNVKRLKLTMQAACLMIDDVPWDEIFGPAEAKCDDKGWFKDEDDVAQDEKATSFEHGANAKSEAPNVSGGSDEDLVECGACHKDVPADATKCPHCGESFEDDGEGSAAAHLDAKPDKPKEDPKPPAKPQAQKAVEESKSNARKGGRSTTGKGSGKTKKPPQDTGETPEEAAKRVLGDDDLPAEKPAAGAPDGEGDPVPWDEDD